MTATSRSRLDRRTFLTMMAAGAAATAAAATGCSSKPKPPRAGEIALPAGGSIARRPLGSTGVQISMIGIGGHHIGRPKEEQEGIRIVRTALDHGVTFLDNCWDYNDGKSEERMGKALRDGYRQKAFLMTKIDGRTRDAAAGQIEQSLRRLQTDTIDLVQIHEVIRPTDPDRVFGPSGAIEALVAARQAGKIRFIGFTGHKDPSIHLGMLETAKAHGFTFDTVQMPINVMDAHYRSFRGEVVPVATARGMGVLGMKSMGDGVLLESKVVTPRECLTYALSQPTSVVITGCESVGVLEQALDVAMRFQPLSETDQRALLARTAGPATDGKYELFKTSDRFDSTAKHPSWLETAKL
jgi:predicted aldo/keto reductase-like oxidoreductase